MILTNVVIAEAVITLLAITYTASRAVQSLAVSYDRVIKRDTIVAAETFHHRAHV